MDRASWKRSAGCVVLGLGLLLAGSGTAQETPPELRLREKLLEVSISENVAVVRLTLNVFNPTDRTLEGRVLLEAPPGSATCEARLAKNLASTQRISKVFDRDRAASLFAAVRDRGERLETWNEFVQAMDRTGRSLPGGRDLSGEPDPGSFAKKPKDTSRVESTPPDVGKSATETKRSDSDIPDKSSSGNPGDIGNAKLQDSNPKEEKPRPVTDPALLEWVCCDTYRLRFYPVLPRADQTVVVTFAVEAIRKDDRLRIRIPLRHDSNLLREDAIRDRIQVVLSSQRAFDGVDSPTHKLLETRTYSRLRYEAQAVNHASDEEFEFAYRPHEAAPLQEFGSTVEEKEWIPSPRRSLGAKEARTALQAKRILERLAADPTTGSLERSRRISETAGIVSHTSSLLVIERWVADDLVRHGIEKAAPMEEPPPGVVSPETGGLFEIGSCDFLRRLKGMPSLHRAISCEERVVWTNDPREIERAVKRGMVARESGQIPNAKCYHYVRHSPECPVKEEAIPALRNIAGIPTGK